MGLVFRPDPLISYSNIQFNFDFRYFRTTTRKYNCFFVFSLSYFCVAGGASFGFLSDECTLN